MFDIKTPSQPHLFTIPTKLTFSRRRKNNQTTTRSAVSIYIHVGMMTIKRRSSSPPPTPPPPPLKKLCLPPNDQQTESKDLPPVSLQQFQDEHLSIYKLKCDQLIEINKIQHELELSSLQKDNYRLTYQVQITKLMAEKKDLEFQIQLLNMEKERDDCLFDHHIELIDKRKWLIYHKIDVLNFQKDLNDLKRERFQLVERLKRMQDIFGDKDRLFGVYQRLHEKEEEEKLE